MTGFQWPQALLASWGWQPSWSQAAVLEEAVVMLELVTSGCPQEACTGSGAGVWLHLVGQTLAKWAELSGLQSWGAPG